MLCLPRESARSLEEAQRYWPDPELPGRVVAGTGHRPHGLGGYGGEAFRRLVVLARRALAEHRPDWVVSGMALGWDQALAEAALDLGLPLVAALPFEGQAARWPEVSQQRYRRILARADRVVVVTAP